MKDKIFKTYEQQIDILKNRGLLITNESINILKYENYYEVINGYKDLFIKNKDPEEFINGSNFKEIYQLYVFDRNLRIIYFKYIIKAEHYIKSILSYEFSKIYGYKDYLKKENFDISSSCKIKSVNNLIIKLNKEIKRNLERNHLSICHYKENYGYIPLWVLMSVLTFGEISHFYYDLKPHDKNVIAKQFNINPDEFSKHINNLSLARNICAHDDKFYDIRFESGLNRKLIPNFNLLRIKENEEYRGTKDIFSVLIMLSIILPKKDIKDLIKNISEEILNLKNNLKTIDISKIFSKMGFADCWKDTYKLCNIK